MSNFAFCLSYSMVLPHRTLSSDRPVTRRCAKFIFVCVFLARASITLAYATAWSYWATNASNLARSYATRSWTFFSAARLEASRCCASANRSYFGRTSQRTMWYRFMPMAHLHRPAAAKDLVFMLSGLNAGLLMYIWIWSIHGCGMLFTSKPRNSDKKRSTWFIIFLHSFHVRFFMLGMARGLAVSTNTQIATICTSSGGLPKFFSSAIEALSSVSSAASASCTSGWAFAKSSWHCRSNYVTSSTILLVFSSSLAAIAFCYSTTDFSRPTFSISAAVFCRASSTSTLSRTSTSCRACTCTPASLILSIPLNNRSALSLFYFRFFANSCL